MTRTTRTLTWGTLSWVGLALLVIWTMFPIAVMVFTSFKPGNEVFAKPNTLLPQNWTIDNFVNVLTDSTVPQALLNSVLVGVLATAITMVLSLSAGYALARFRYRGSRALSLFILMGQFIPITVLLLPFFIAINAMGLIDTIGGLAITHLVITVPLVTWMVRNQFASVPIELEEAAMIDGSTRLGAVLKITLPVAMPGLAAAAMFAFLQSWHEFVFASVITQSPSSRTGPISLTEFAGEFTVDWGATMAAAVVLTVPVVIIFLCLQRYFVAGLTSGAVKG
ncbi:carbohydrate ABC transporter permease [Mycetocola tolaasinivorans]|uniref:Carbohydrate ABC transporter permease n=2 Tax=Mycetocola tolaasinivorans TaxID=76635 RepID=A0A3L7A3D8_9MICO|nr:carbohydrate ABC transporter permease [Mycetocola tolaasinivorans]